MTFLFVASRTSKAGTIVPAGKGSILRVPAESLSTRSATSLRCSKIVSEAGQLAWIFRTTGDCAVATGRAWPQTRRVTTATARTITATDIGLNSESHFLMKAPPGDIGAGSGTQSFRRGRGSWLMVAGV